MSDSSNSFWQALPALKERQRRTGLLAALVLGLAVLVLVDGLQALMRAGSYHLDIVAGQGTMLSGPIGIDKPRDSDLLVSVTPEGAPLSFRLDGFFASYWFGNGMWRGEIVAEQGATPGTYALSVRVRGTPASATQRYEVTVWSDAASLRQGAYSLTVSLLGFNPFWLSGILACIGVVPGLLSFLSGRRIVRLLWYAGFSEVFRTEARKDGSLMLWCSGSKKEGPAEGALCEVVDAGGQLLGRARLEKRPPPAWNCGWLPGNCPTAKSRKAATCVCPHRATESFAQKDRMEGFPAGRPFFIVCELRPRAGLFGMSRPGREGGRCSAVSRKKGRRGGNSVMPATRPVPPSPACPACRRGGHGLHLQSAVALPWQLS